MKTHEELINAFDDEEVLGWVEKISETLYYDLATKIQINEALAHLMLATEYLVKEIGLDNNTLSKMVTQGADKFRSKLM